MINILSPYELVAIFCYGLSYKGRTEIKELLERYHVLYHLNPIDLGRSSEKDNRKKMTNFKTDEQPTGTDFDYYVTITNFNDECYLEYAFVKQDNYHIPHFEVREPE